MDEPNKRFVVGCPHCGAKLRVLGSDLGSERACPKCTARFALPDRSTALRAERIQRAKSEFSFPCILCGTVLYAEPNRTGCKLNCPDCHAVNVVPPIPVKPAKPQVNSLAFADELKLRDENEPAVDDQFQVRCPKCDGMEYARPQQIGKSILCPDCGSIIVVRSPPIKVVQKLQFVDPKIELTEAEKLPEMANKAAAHMESARRDVERKEREAPIPPKRPFRDGVYTFPFDLEILPRWLIVAILGCIGWSVFQYGQSCRSSGPEAIIAMACGILLVFISLGTSLILFGMCLTIVEFTAMGYSKAPHWPGFDIVDRLRSLTLFTAAFGFSVLPVTMISLFLPENIPFFGYTAPAVAFVAFPLIFLSMLDNNSMAVPYSKLVFGSWRKHRKLWNGFYTACLPLVLLVGAGAWLAHYVQQDKFTWGYIFLVTACVMIYVRLVGRLGWSLDQVIDIQNLGVDGEEKQVPVHEHAS